MNPATPGRRAATASLFGDDGFTIVSSQPRVFPHQAEAIVLEQIHSLALRLGGDLDRAVHDAWPLHRVIHALRG